MARAAPFKKGRAKTGGRVVGTPNKLLGVKRSWRSARDICLRENFDPIEFLIAFATDDKKKLKIKGNAPIDPALRMRAAAEAAKYIHPQIKAHQFQGEGGEDLGKMFAEAVIGSLGKK